METKGCNICGQEKPLTEYGKYKGRDGEYHLRNVCRVCKNKQRGDNVPKGKTTARAKKKPKQEELLQQVEPIENQLSITDIQEQEPKKNPIRTNTDKQNNKCECCFSPEDIETIKDMVLNHKRYGETAEDNHKSNHNNYGEVMGNRKSDRIKTTYNVDYRLKHELNDYCRDRALNNSDVVNVAIEQYLIRYHRKK